MRNCRLGENRFGVSSRIGVRATEAIDEPVVGRLVGVDGAWVGIVVLLEAVVEPSPVHRADGCGSEDGLVVVEVVRVGCRDSGGLIVVEVVESAGCS